MSLYFQSYRRTEIDRFGEEFGFLTFVHEYHFNRLLAKGTAPRELTLMMIASAMRSVLLFDLLGIYLIAIG